MVYATEETPLGTAGSVRNAMDELDERFLVISGDVLTDIDLGAIVEGPRRAQAPWPPSGSSRVENPLEFGIVITQEDGSIERFLEKPTWGQVFSDTINTGIFVLEPEIFDYIAPDRPVDFSSRGLPRAPRRRQAAVRGGGRGLLGGRRHARGLPPGPQGHPRRAGAGRRARASRWATASGIGEGAEVHPEATIVGPAVIGENCRVEAGVRLGPYTVLGTNVRVRADADLERVVIHDNSYLGEGVRLRGAIVGRSCDLRGGVRCDEGVVLGDECFVGEHAVLAAGVKVYPFKTVEAGAVINSSIVWESRGSRSLFGRVGVAGLANVDITPELATRLAMAYGTTLKKDSTVITSRDSSRSARMLKRAMMAGLNAVGVNVLDLEVASVPVTRFAIRRPEVAGGLTIRLVEGDPQSCVIRFFDTNGSDLTEDGQRKVERLFVREDFRRAFPAEIGDIGFPPRALEHYTAALEATVDIAAIRAARFKVVVDYSFGSTSFVMPNVLAKLGADVLGVNPYASTGRSLTFDKAAHAQDVGRAGAGVGRAPRRGDRLRRRAPHPHRRHRPRAHRRPGAAGPPAPRARAGCSATPSPCRSRSPRTPRPSPRSYGVHVRRTKLASSALMDAAAEPGVGFAASTDGGFILPGFLPAFDAAATLVKVLELLALAETRLSPVVEDLPRTRMAHETVVTPWEQKGMVMRTLVEMSKDREVELIDGVQVRHDDGWALALPDPEEPVTHVWAEAATDADAKALAKEYARRIRQLLR